MSRHITMKAYGPEQAAVARGIATTLNRIDGKEVDELNHFVERTGTSPSRRSWPGVC